MPAPPPPFHILRAHSAPLSTLYFTAGNQRLIAGDQDGVVSVSDLRSRRVISSWHAHDGGVLGVGEWAGGVVSQGRDNCIKFYSPLTRALDSSPSEPKLEREIPSNALNFCAFSLARLGVEEPSISASAPATTPGGAGSRPAAVLALPNLTDSELIDIYTLPGLDRVGAAVNFVPRAKNGPRSGLVMSLHVAVVGSQEATEEGGEDRVALLAGYEDGRAELWSAPLSALERKVEWDGRKAGSDRLWTRKWEGKTHNEAVMAMAVDRTFTRAFTASADHRVVRIDLAQAMTGGEAIKAYSTGQIGNSALSVSGDGRILAVGGWDGKIRLFSAATLKPLGTLAYHRDSVQALAWGSVESAPAQREGTVTVGEDESDSDSDDGDTAGDPRNWLASGGKDRRIALWSIGIAR